MFLDCGDYTATIYQTGSFNIIITKGTIRSLHVWEIGSLGGEKWGFGGKEGALSIVMASQAARMSFLRAKFFFFKSSLGRFLHSLSKWLTLPKL